ncbi:hypothetical protein SLEP1_g43195 [Rubroshorea leprosula]|uniref:Uncharacterized protein n=1 Tax=Rubroshorea leprosula TaxID=152421 RepID=A0AAV5LD64_9ROSI|nr:hypothetical protein SLEP1_g43195 [Rubroshorea leprosula]
MGTVIMEMWRMVVSTVSMESVLWSRMTMDTDLVSGGVQVHNSRIWNVNIFFFFNPSFFIPFMVLDCVTPYWS